MTIHATRGTHIPELKRNIGHILTITARPEIEEYFKKVSGGYKEPMSARTMLPLDSSDKGYFQIYDVHGVSATSSYSFSAPLTLFTDENHMPTMWILRAAGISQGLRIAVTGAYSQHTLSRQLDQFGKAVSIFIREAIEPADVTLTIT